MKKLPLLFALFIMLSSSCAKEELEENNVDPNKPWLENLYSENPYFNNQQISNSLLGARDNYDMEYTVRECDLPSGTITQVKLYLYIPGHPNPEYSAGINIDCDNDNFIINYSGGSISDICVISGTSFIGKKPDPNDNSKSISGYEIIVNIPNSPVTSDNLYFILFPFDLIYQDENGNEFYSSKRTLTIFTAIC